MGFFGKLCNGCSSSANLKVENETPEEKQALVGVPEPAPQQKAADVDAECDAQRFQNVLKGWSFLSNNKEKKMEIIRLVAYRSSEQLKAIADIYKSRTGDDLVERLKNKLKGHFRTVVLKRFYNRHELAAKRCHEAMDGPGADKKALIQTICTKLPADITAMIEAYKTMFGSNLEDDVHRETSGALRNILISLLTAARAPETTEVDDEEALKDATLLWKGEATDSGEEPQELFNRIVANRSRAQLRAIIACFATLGEGASVEKAIGKVMKGNVKQAFLTIVKCVVSEPAYYAEQIYYTMKGMGTSDNELIQLVLERCEIDMKEIKVEFEKKYLQIDNRTMAQWIIADTSGPYRIALLALITHPDDLDKLISEHPKILSGLADEEPAGAKEKTQPKAAGAKEEK